MRTIWDTEDFGAVVGVDWYRWYVGASYEPLGDIRAVVLRLGPVYLHLINRL